jgi:hypothetical protein
MADNPIDIADNGTVPSPGVHWISPDVWNRRAQVTTNACVLPAGAYGTSSPPVVWWAIAARPQIMKTRLRA